MVFQNALHKPHGDRAEGRVVRRTGQRDRPSGQDTRRRAAPFEMQAPMLDRRGVRKHPACSVDLRHGLRRPARTIRMGLP